MLNLILSRVKNLFIAAVRINVEQSFHQERGCQIFDICQDRQFLDSIFLYEVYDDEVAFEKHKLTLH